MFSQGFPGCCNARIIYGLNGVTPTRLKRELAQAKVRNNTVVAITADHQSLATTMKASGFTKVGDARRRNGFITLWAWLNPMPKVKKAKKATKRARR